MSPSVDSDDMAIPTMSISGWNSTDNDNEGFCTGSGIVHYMDGFHLTLKGGYPCLNLFSSNWTLDSPGKFIGAMFGVLFFAMMVEGTSKLRTVCLDRARARYANIIAASNSNNGKNKHKSNVRIQLLRGGLMALRGIQAFLGYALMLAAMSFSIEMILMIVTGLALGYLVFYQTDSNYFKLPTAEDERDPAQEEEILSCDLIVEDAGASRSSVFNLRASNRNRKENEDNNNGFGDCDDVTDGTNDVESGRRRDEQAPSADTTV